MATFGQGINPALGRTDYTPFLQGSVAGAEMGARGAESIGRGLAMLGQQVGSAIQAYNQKQEQKKMEETATSAVASFIKAYPQLGSQLGITNVEDKGVLKTVVKSMGGAGPTLSMLSQLERMAYEQSRRPSQEALAAAQIANVQSDTTRNLAASMPQPVDPLDRQYKTAQIAKLQAETGAIGQPKQLDPLQQAQLNKLNQDMVSEQAKEADAAKKAASQTEQYNADLDNALFNIAQAKRLLGGGAGGTVAGLPIVRDVNAAFGAGGAKQLNSLYNTLKATLSLNKLMEMKRNSPNGASGLGNTSEKEFTATGSTIVELDPSLPEDVQLQRLNQLQKTINRMRFGSGGSPAATGPRIISVEPIQ